LTPSTSKPSKPKAHSRDIVLNPGARRQRPGTKI
jgi:hypothetical protein